MLLQKYLFCGAQHSGNVCFRQPALIAVAVVGSVSVFPQSPQSTSSVLITAAVVAISDKISLLQRESPVICLHARESPSYPTGSSPTDTNKRT